MKRGDTYRVTSVDHERRSVTIGVDVQRDRIEVGTKDGGSYFAALTPRPSRRLRFPIGRRERLADILGWTVTSEQVKRGTLTQEAKLASDDRNGCVIIDPKDSTRREWHPGRPYDRMGVTVLLGLMRRQATQTNKRRGWRPDGSEVGA